MLARKLIRSRELGRLGVRTYTVGDDVRVALEGPLGVSVLGLVPGEVPDDQAVVTATREEHVGAKIADQTSAIEVQSKVTRHLQVETGVAAELPEAVQHSPPGSEGSRFAIVRTYFSIEVASEVTQPFCTKSVSACPVDHRDSSSQWRRPREAGRRHWQGTSPPVSMGDLRGPQGCP